MLSNLLYAALGAKTHLAFIPLGRKVFSPGVSEFSAIACIGFSPQQYWHPGIGDEVSCCQAGTVLAGGTLSDPKH